MMNATDFLKSSSKFSREVMYCSPCLLTEVVTIGASSCSTCFENQCSGILTPNVFSPGATFSATQLLFFFRMMVNGPGSLLIHSAAFPFTMQHSFIHSLDGAMTENGASFLFFSFLIFATAFLSCALQPIPYTVSVG